MSAGEWEHEAERVRLLPDASMRPRHVCRGMPLDGPPCRERPHRFNEAPACLPGNDHVRRERFFDGAQLQ